MTVLPPPEQVKKGVQVNNLTVHEFVFRDPITGKNAEPDTLVVSIKPPTGEAATYNLGDDPDVIVRRGPGVYYVKVLHDAVGTWRVRVTAASLSYESVALIEVVDSYV